uniref:THAP-type domain-containing protein n=1 Tax=Graphocephala atropunctata TaxID=36148 RepID=A0A1B6MLV8_9HEMI
MSRNCCSYLDCRNSAHKVKGLRMFTFPLKEELSSIWVSNCGNPILNKYTALELRKNKRVCELHFRREDITVSGRLKDGSIPIPYDEPLMEPDTTTSSCLAIPMWGSQLPPSDSPEQEVKHEVFIKAEIEIDDGFDVSYNDPIGNFLEESETPDQDDPATASLSTPPEKKRKLCLSPPPSGSLGAGDGSLQQEIPKAETEFDLWARSVAHQLNNMELRRALQLQLKMQTLMTEDRIREDCDNMDMNPR